jgi:hypothetical protein
MVRGSGSVAAFGGGGGEGRRGGRGFASTADTSSGSGSISSGGSLTRARGTAGGPFGASAFTTMLSKASSIHESGWRPSAIWPFVGEMVDLGPGDADSGTGGGPDDDLFSGLGGAGRGGAGLGGNGIAAPKHSTRHHEALPDGRGRILPP